MAEAARYEGEGSVPVARRIGELWGTQSAVLLKEDSRSLALVQEGRTPALRAGTDARGVLDLSRDTDLGILPEHVVAAVESSLDRGETHYTHRPGLPALMEAIAGRLERNQGVQVDPALGVVITCGGREALFVALQVVLEPGGEVLVPALRPAWIDRAIHLARGTAVPIPVTRESGFSVMAEKIQGRLSSRSQVLLVASPSNPTGAVVQDEELGRIAALAADCDLLILADESLDESLAGGVRHRSIASFAESAGRTLTVGSFSYLYNLASWRVGYLAGPNAYVQPIRSLKRGMSLVTSTMAQFAALAALTGDQAWLFERRGEIDAKRALVLQALDRMSIDHSRPAATPFVWVMPPEMDRTAPSEGEFMDRLSEAGVVVAPGHEFGTRAETGFRLSLWATPSELVQAMERFRAVV